jgi:hypothetical protein
MWQVMQQCTETSKPESTIGDGVRVSRVRLDGSEHAICLMECAERMIEAGMESSSIDDVARAELLDAAESLKLGSIHDIDFGSEEDHGPADRKGERLDLVVLVA